MEAIFYKELIISMETQKKKKGKLFMVEALYLGLEEPKQSKSEGKK